MHSMSLQDLARVFARTDLRPDDKLALIMVANCGDLEDPTTWPDAARLSEWTGYPEFMMVDFLDRIGNML